MNLHIDTHGRLSYDADPSCTYCSEIARTTLGSALHSLLRDWSEHYGYVLHESENFSVLPAIGSCCDGYVLMLPKAHLMSFGLLSAELDNEFENLVERITSYLRHKFGLDVVIFEHGAKSSRSRAGSCMDHAHLHRFHPR